MRIITGSLKGRRLKTPDNDRVRPTSDRTKESMFSVIDARRYFDGLHVADLFAGSGNLGFEAVSRGVAQVTFVESDRTALKTIEENARLLDVASVIRIVPGDVMRYLAGPPRKFDLIFADPPYDLPELAALPDMILQNGWLADGGWFLLEHDRRHTFAEHPNCVFSKPYGRTIVSIFREAGDDSDDSDNDDADPGAGPHGDLSGDD